MRYPTEDDPELMEAIRRYVTSGESADRRYLKLLGGQFAQHDGPDKAAFLRALVEDAHQITDHELGVLLDCEWRSRITAAWLIGISRRDQFRERLGTMLLASELVYAGQSYCFALARLGAEQDAEILTSYLDHYLPRDDCQYDQPWALGALLHIDELQGANHASRFLQPDGLWQHWAKGRFDAAVQKKRIDELSSYVDKGPDLA
ncbi:DUF6000 family protein [Streptomyces hygroscopicus]|uniref:DUF6000 family protein n=1 Tax=Streptomyces hygroscopicus TaxID=1912 RepID=UPI001B806BDA|nr:DUF6000 family protein [Streptomyces hygroscopicus]GLV79928.1 hypothetical protein Shyhy02_79280 [Streptomyces hygroscopicus subsp. hygroscopicus]